jgi:hypothetical protein
MIIMNNTEGFIRVEKKPALRISVVREFRQ